MAKVGRRLCSLCDETEELLNSGRDGRTVDSVAGDPTITTRAKTFVDGLSPGDLLLFDTTKLVSQLVKLAENCPVNHCAIYVGDQHMVQMGSGTAHVNDDDLLLRLTNGESPVDRTVTALRHRRVRDAIAERACQYRDDQDLFAKYSYFSLRYLMLPSLYRNYQRELKDHRAEAVLLPTIRWLAQAILGWFEKGGLLGDAKRLKQRTMTCSEFVYRCYDEAKVHPSLVVEVENPLATWDERLFALVRGERWQSARSGGSASAKGLAALADDEGDASRDEGADEGEVPLALHQSIVDGPELEVDLNLVGAPIEPFEDELFGFLGEVGGGKESVLIDGQAMSAADLGRKVADWRIKRKEAVELRMWIREMYKCLAVQNASYRKYEADHVRRRVGDVFADSVTPRDLWSSRSLEAISVFHCPAGA
jgi:hypothetical protein